MELTKSQIQAISLEIIKKAGVKCPVCGQSKSFSIAQTEFHLLAGVPDENGGISFKNGATYLKVVAATCSNCAHISLFNLAKLEKRMAEK